MWCDETRYRNYVSDLRLLSRFYVLTIMATTSPTSSGPPPLVASESETEIASELLGEVPAPIQPGTLATTSLAQFPPDTEAVASVATADDANSVPKPSKNECGASNVESGSQDIAGIDLAVKGDNLASNNSFIVASASVAIPDSANSTLEAINGGPRISNVESGPQDIVGIDPAVGDASVPNYPPIIHAPVNDQSMEKVQPDDGVKLDCPQNDNMDHEMGDAENGADEEDEDEEDDEEGSSEVSEGGDLIVSYDRLRFVQ